MHRYVTALADSGFIELIPNHRRNIRLIDEIDEDKKWYLPLMGKIAAGSPIEAIEDDQHIDVSKVLLGPNRFVLEVKGDSMIGDNICDGDYIICESDNKFTKNTIAVVLVDNQETTLKRIYPNEDGSVTLIPSNPTLSPAVYQQERIQVQGIYIGLFRLSYL